MARRRRTDRTPATGARPPAAADNAARIHRLVLVTLQVIMALALLGALYEGQWLNGPVVLAIMLLTLVPAALGRRLQVLDVPAEFEVLAVVFVFAALFLGEVRGYYERFGWWDIALHTTSGLLLGILGFLLVYVLNADERIDLHMRPRFVALFAFTFAMAVGALWETFEFGMDRTFGMNMQKPMFGDPSGLTDTMWDLIVDALGPSPSADSGGGTCTATRPRSSRRGSASSSSAIRACSGPDAQPERPRAPGGGRIDARAPVLPAADPGGIDSTARGGPAHPSSRSGACSAGFWGRPRTRSARSCRPDGLTRRAAEPPGGIDAPPGGCCTRRACVSALRRGRAAACSRGVLTSRSAWLNITAPLVRVREPGLGHPGAPCEVCCGAGEGAARRRAAARCGHVGDLAAWTTGLRSLSWRTRPISPS